MSDTYITRQGDTWDTIALEIYGNEIYAGFLMENNYAHLDTLIFSAGAILSTPELPEETESELPPWRDDEEPAEDDVDPYA